MRRPLVFPLLLCVTVAACSGPAPPRRAILILLDAARADRFSSYGYERETTPVMDELASRGVLFENALSQATHTRTSLPSIMYSRYLVRSLFPGSDQVPFSSPEELFFSLDDEAISIPEAFSQEGIHTAMISAHSWLRPDTLFARSFDDVYDLASDAPIDPNLGYPEAGYVIAQYRTGMLYQEGIGTAFDLKKAKEWLSRAAIQGYPQARAALTKLGVTPPTVEKEKKKTEKK